MEMRRDGINMADKDVMEGREDLIEIGSRSDHNMVVAVEMWSWDPVDVKEMSEDLTEIRG